MIRENFWKMRMSFVQPPDVVSFDLAAARFPSFFASDSNGCSLAGVVGFGAAVE